MLKEKLENKTAKILIIGGGYVGLPLAVRCAESGFKTAVYDVDAQKVDAINRRESYLGDVPNSQLLQFSMAQLFGTHSPAPWDVVDVVLICVPTPLNKTRDPDVSYILEAAEALRRDVLHNDEQLVVLESTVYPGFTREVLQEALGKDGWTGHVAFSPERVDPNNETYTIKNTPKLVGGVGKESSEVAVSFYEQIIDKVVSVSSADVAEMGKVYENTFRMINIAFANETAKICRELNLDVWEVIDAAATKPFGFMKFIPGAGVGGHCISTDPHYLAWQLRKNKYSARFIQLAEEINTSMPKYIASQVADILSDWHPIPMPLREARILVVGVAYKPNISDCRESPALDIISTLNKKCCQVEYYDPLVPSVVLDGETFKSKKPDDGEQYDCAIIATNHDCIDYELVADNTYFILDVRNTKQVAHLPHAKLDVADGVLVPAKFPVVFKM